MQVLNGQAPESGQAADGTEGPIGCQGLAGYAALMLIESPATPVSARSFTLLPEVLLQASNHARALALHQSMAVVDVLKHPAPTAANQISHW